MGPIKVYDVQPTDIEADAFCHVFVDGGNRICGKTAKWRGMYHGESEIYYESVASGLESVDAILLEVCEAHAQQLWPEAIKAWTL